MATTSATSSTNLDINSIVSQLMTVERQPINQLNLKEAAYQAKLSAYGSVKGAVSGFQTALQGLSSASFQRLTATSSDSTVVSAAATSLAVAGIYSMEVTTLAQSQKLVAAGQASSSTAIGTGAATLVTFDFGSISGGMFDSVTGKYSGAAFTSNGGDVKSITIDNSNNTLEGIRDAINVAKIGVSATLINDGSGTPYRLALSSDSTGANNSIKISTDGVDAAIDTLLVHNPAGTQNLAESVTAQDATLKINGVAVSRSTNTVSDAIQGVTLTLSQVSTTPINLAVAKDTTSVTTSVSSFVKAYNDLSSTLQSLSAYNATSKSGAILQGDATVRTLQFQLRGLLSKSVSDAGALNTLSDIGVSFQKDGKLALNQTKLDTALTGSLADVANLFTSSTGYATTLGNWAGSVLASGGPLANRSDGLGLSIQQLGVQRAALETRLVGIEKRYRAQFIALDVMLSNMNQTSTYLTQQLANISNLNTR